MGWMRLTLIFVSIVLISPVTAGNFFTARFVFFALLLIDFMKIRSSDSSDYNNFVGTVGVWYCRLVVLIDAFGAFNLLLLKHNSQKEAYYVTSNPEYPFLNFVHDFPVMPYMFTTSFLTLAVVGWEIWTTRKETPTTVNNESEVEA
ncbi:hypothetical protein Q9251_08230 [Alkalihalobacillus macyae]|uniref:hypothetical protein n=1 Tax=Guptibacillus hwajinpoensis TaxID=208199 RepID=UPI00273C6EE3|nr:hypothetical protein [Alkalihalobacillus macyae]MDP4550870.1 hypothetical protein [Alkalihalobacillus macyae]